MFSRLIYKEHVIFLKLIDVFSELKSDFRLLYEDSNTYPHFYVPEIFLLSGTVCRKQINMLN